MSQQAHWDQLIGKKVYVRYADERGVRRYEGSIEGIDTDTSGKMLIIMRDKFNQKIFLRKELINLMQEEPE